jgi:cell division protein FtsW (lipid II flippase)
MVYSAGQVNIPNPVTFEAWLRQTRWFVLALVAFTFIARVPLPWLEWVAVPAYVVSVVLLAVTLVIGTGSGTAAGVKSWIDLGFISFQPSEIAKLATILDAGEASLAARESAHVAARPRRCRAALVGLPLVLVMLQPDLGTAMAFVGILLAMLYWAGTPVALLLLVASPVVASSSPTTPRPGPVHPGASSASCTCTATGSSSVRVGRARARELRAGPSRGRSGTRWRRTSRTASWSSSTRRWTRAAPATS